MTCRECGSARHTPKHCSDFLALDSHGMAHPRRPSASKYANSPVHLSIEKVWTCDNYGCRDMHSHFDCPLPTICWGYRSTCHFWASCTERCTKCGAKRHIAEYCDEFELWRDDLSRPKRPPQDVITYAMKRQREQEIDCQQGLEASNPQSKRQRNATSTIRVDSSPRIKTDEESSSPSFRPQDQYDPICPTLIDRYRPQDGQASNPFCFSRRLRTKRGSPAPASSHNNSHPIGRNMIDIRVRDKEYCTFWLRMGRCNYEHTPLGCKYKHEVPDKKTLNNMGVQFVPDWLKKKQRPQPRAYVYKAPVPINTPLPQGSPSFPRQCPSYVQPAGEPRRQRLPTPSATVSTSPDQPVQQFDRAGSMTSAVQPSSRPSTSPGIPLIQSDKIKAFKEEEYFKQKRHDAEMKRKADIQKLEYDHELRMAKLRQK